MADEEKTSGKVFVVVCAQCDFTKTRKHIGDAKIFQKQHAAEWEGHTVTIEQRDDASASVTVSDRMAIARAAKTTKAEKE